VFRLDINTLNAFLGYGDFRNADMLVLSKHEGADNTFLDHELGARMNHFGLEPEHWLDGIDRVNGYWHSSTETGRYIKNTLFQNGKGNNAAVPFVVSYPARILLALEEAFETNSYRNIHNWFQPLGDDSYSNKIQELSKVIYSYNHSTKWKAVLSHYQPLPRQNGTWPYTEYFPAAEFQNVFGKEERPLNQAIMSLKKRREDILAKLLREYPKKLIFSTGNFQGESRDSLTNFFIREFEAAFKTFSFGGHVRGLKGEFTYKSQKTVVIHTQGFAFGGGLTLDHVKNITRLIYNTLNE